MTSPADITRLVHRVINSANIIKTRLPYAGLNTIRNTANGYPTTASGNANQGARGTSELTPTEAAAHTNLGDLHGYDDYHPGPTTRLADLADELQAALTSLDRAHTQLTTIGVPPLITRQYRCRGINSTGCTGWIDMKPDGSPRRDDRLCLDCGRRADLAARAQRDRIRYHRATGS